MELRFKSCDPVHGFIRFGEREKRFIHSRPFQRLRYIRQMGVAYLVYPGATHTRFDHSLGVMELATRMFHRLSPSLPQEEGEYWLQILRLAALAHDIGHLPFSHTAERVLLPEGGHEAKTEELLTTPELRPLWRELGSHAEEDIIALAVGSAAPSDSIERILATVITDDNFGADRIDYLVRDAYYTGAGYGLFDFHQLIDSLQLLPFEGEKGERAAQKEKWRLGITLDGIQSVEALWVARYMMFARVYKHPKVRLYSYHMARFMKRYYEETLPYLDQTDVTILQLLWKAAAEGDEDAEILLLRRPADPLALPMDKAAYQEEMTRRDFPVLSEEGKILSSRTVSPFLDAIPFGR